MFARLDGDRRDARLLDRLGRLDLAAVSISALHFDEGENEYMLFQEKAGCRGNVDEEKQEGDQCRMKKQKKENEETNFTVFVID